MKMVTWQSRQKLKKMMQRTNPQYKPFKLHTMQHELKTWTEYYQKIKSGEKTFELRNNDRGFKVGDTLLLKEVTPKGYSDVNPNQYITEYTGQQMEVRVTYVLEYRTGFGLLGNYCVMSITTLISEGDRSAHRSKAEILAQMRIEMPFALPERIKPYIEEAMESYATAKVEAYKNNLHNTTDETIAGLKKIKEYFGEHGATPHQHWLYKVADNALQELEAYKLTQK